MGTFFISASVHRQTPTPTQTQAGHAMLGVSVRGKPTETDLSLDKLESAQRVGLHLGGGASTVAFFTAIPYY